MSEAQATSSAGTPAGRAATADARVPETSATPASGRGWRQVPRAVAAVSVLFGLVLGLWSVAVPQYRAPDEPAHLDLVLLLAEGVPYPEYDGRFVGRAIGLSRDPYLIARDTPWPRFAATDAPPRTQRLDLWDLGGTEPDPDVRTTGEQALVAGAPYVYNQMPQHPPLYHQAMAMVLRVERAVLPGPRPPPLDRELGLLRLVNALLILPLPVLAWAAARRMGAAPAAALTASVLPLGLPQLTHIGASLNNDNLLTLLAGVLAVLLAGVARGRRTARTDVAVGVVVGLAMLTKAFALALIPWVVAAYVLAWLVRGAAADGRRDVTIGSLRAGALAIALGAWWWVLNLVRHGEPAPTSETLTRVPRLDAEGFEPDRLGYAYRFVTRMATRSWAWVGFRAPKVELPGPVTLVLTLLALAAVVTAIVTRGRATPEASDTGGTDADAATSDADGRAGEASADADSPARRRSRPLRRELLLALAPVVLLFVAVSRRAYGLHVTTGGYSFVQGRYLYAGIVPLMVLVAIGAHHVLGRRAPIALLSLGAALQGWMLLRVLDGAWAGAGVTGPLGSMLAWSPWPAGVVQAVALAAGGALAWTARAIPAALVDDSTESGSVRSAGEAS